MKNKLQLTILRHKLSWLLCLVAFFAAVQNAVATEQSYIKVTGNVSFDGLGAPGWSENPDDKFKLTSTYVTTKGTMYYRDLTVTNTSQACKLIGSSGWSWTLGNSSGDDYTVSNKGTYTFAGNAKLESGHRMAVVLTSKKFVGSTVYLDLTDCTGWEDYEATFQAHLYIDLDCHDDLFLQTLHFTSLGNHIYSATITTTAPVYSIKVTRHGPDGTYWDQEVSLSDWSSEYNCVKLKSDGKSAEKSSYTACTDPTAGFAISAASTTPKITTKAGTVSTTLSTAATGMGYYSWACTQKPSDDATPTFGSASAASTTVTLPLEGEYKFQLTAGCSQATAVASAVLTVTVSGQMFIKGPVYDRGCWNDTRYQIDGSDGVYTKTFTANKQSDCGYGRSEYILCAANDDAQKFNDYRDHFSHDGTSGDWEVSDRNTDYNFRVVETYYSDYEQLTITVTHLHDTYYKMKVTKSCVSPEVTADPSSATYCQGASATALSVTATGTATLTYQWQKSTDGGSNYSNISGATSSTYTPSTTSAGTTLYKCVVTNSCGSDTSDAATIKVDATPVAGNITGAGAICIDNDSRTLTLTGSTGTREWQFSNSEGGPYSKADGAATGTTYVVNSGHGGWYRVKVTSGVCTEVYATAVEVTEDAESDPGTLSPGTAGTTICVGSSKTLTTAGSLGSLQWKQSTSATGTYTNVTSGTGATTVSYNTGVVASAGNTYYKVEAKNGACPAVLSDYTFVSARTVPTASDFTMTNNEQSCGSVEAPTITKTSGIGNMTVYYSNATYSKSTTLPTAVGTYKVTVDVAKGSSYCATTGIELTESFIINKANQAALTISTSATKHICTQTSGAATQEQLEVSGGTTSGVVTYAITGGTAQASASVGANTGILTCSEAGTVEVTATMAGDDCYNDVVSTPKTFTFDKMTQAATITGAGEICSGESTTLTATNYLADTFQWMISTDGSTFTNIDGATSNTYTTETLSATKYYKISVRNGVCSSQGSGRATVTVKASTIGSKDAPTFNVAVGQSEGPKNFTFTQCGYTVTTSDVSIVGTDASQFAMGTVTIDGNTITVPVTFTPTSVGSKTAKIQILDSSHQFPITATGVCKSGVSAANYSFTGNNVTYNGNNQAPTIAPVDATAGNVTTVYYAGTAGSGKTNVGTYAITIDSEAGTKYCGASKLSLGNFVINPATPTNADFTYSIPANKTFDDAYAKATVSVKSGVSGMGAVTVKYNGATAADGVKNAGTYAVTFDVAAGTNYTSATGLVPTPTSSFKISKAAGSITITNDQTSFCQDAGNPTVTSTRTGDGTVTYEITVGGDKADINASTGVLTYKAPGTFTVRATVAEGTNHLTASAAKEFTFVQAPNAGTLSADVAVCSGNSTTLTTTSSVGTLQWKSSTSASGTYSNVSGGSGATTASYTTAALTQTTYYKVEATNGVCSAALSATPVTVTVNANPTLTIDLTSSPGEGLVYEWEWATFTPTTNGTITAKSINRTTGTSSSKCVFGGEGDVLTVKAHPTGDVYQASYTATSNGCSTTVTKDVTVTKVIEVCP